MKCASSTLVRVCVIAKGLCLCFLLYQTNVIADVATLAGSGNDLLTTKDTQETQEATALEETRVQWIKAIANDRVESLASMLDHSDDAHLEALLKVRAPNGKTALMVACKEGDIDLARSLVVAGADVNALTGTGGTAFMFAILGGHLDVARWLLGHDVDISARGSNGWSALTIAAAKGEEVALAWLLNIGAAFDQADVYGYTPMMRAVDNHHLQVVAKLLDAGAAVSAADELGNTALHHAVTQASVNSEMVALLLEHHADAHATNSDGMTALDLSEEDAVRRQLLGQ